MSPWCALLWCQPSTTAPFSGPHWEHANTEVLSISTKHLLVSLYIVFVECPFLLQFIGIHIFLQLLMVSIQESDMSSENWLAFM